MRPLLAMIALYSATLFAATEAIRFKIEAGDDIFDMVAQKIS